MGVLVVSGTGTGVGKTVVTAAIAALAATGGSRVAVVKPAQTGVGPGELGDLDVIRRLAAVTDLHEYVRLPVPLSPAAAARNSGVRPADLGDIAVRIRRLAAHRDTVVIEGAGGLLVRYDEQGATIADLAADLGAAVLVVVDPALGTLNHTALTVEAIAHRGLSLAGIVVGAWPQDPDLACRSNLRDLESVAGQPLAGVMAAGAGSMEAPEFLLAARTGLGPSLGGVFDAADFRRAYD